MSLSETDGWIVTEPGRPTYNGVRARSKPMVTATPHVPWYRNKAIVDKTPLVSVALLEAANVQQLVQMWTQHTAAGQSMTAWLTVNIALWLWLNFYLTFNRDNKFAIWGTAFGIGMNTLVIATVAWFRYL